MKNMRHFLIRRLTNGALGVSLMIPVEKLITITNAASRELPLPTAEAQGKPLDGLGAWSPINFVTRGN